MDFAARRLLEQKINIAAAKGLVEAGCTVSVVEGKTVFISDSTDPVAIDAALYASGEPCFMVKRIVDGRLQEGWVDFVGPNGIEVTASEHLELDAALEAANTLAIQLNMRRPVVPLITEGHTK